tara:strand:+ start:996 stop:1517 length:522 start_codon:yes stop_codon:yes gene_type:complete
MENITEVSINNNTEVSKNNNIEEVSINNNTDNISKANTNIDEFILNNNDLVQVLKSIEIIQSTGKIKAKDMYKIGTRYLRLCSYLEYMQLSDDERDIAIKDEQENKEGTKYLKKLELQDLVFYFNFIHFHIKEENFIDNLDNFKNTHQKIFTTLKPYFKQENDIQTNESFNPL